MQTANLRTYKQYKTTNLHMFCENTQHSDVTDVKKSKIMFKF